MFRRFVIATGFVGLVAAACTNGSRSGSNTSSPGSVASSPAASSPYTVTINAADFSATVDNPYFPLKPGTTLIYRGTKDELPGLEILHVSNQTKRILGVPCVVVQDVLSLGGHVEETTLDYYTQDKDGNVWYFGEDTQELNAKGQILNTEGSWMAGVDGAQPGIFMAANPEIGKPYRQEYYPGQAEDFFAALSTTDPVTVPYRMFPNSLLTREWSPLEPNTLDHKNYVKGIGEVAEVSVKGPLERFVLVDYRPA